MGSKYKLTDESKVIKGRTVYRIRALRSFGTIYKPVKIGDLGGFIESEENLSQSKYCWLFDEAVGMENSRRYDNSVG